MIAAAPLAINETVQKGTPHPRFEAVGGHEFVRASRRAFTTIDEARRLR